MATNQPVATNQPRGLAGQIASGLQGLANALPIASAPYATLKIPGKAGLTQAPSISRPAPMPVTHPMMPARQTERPPTQSQVNKFRAGERAPLGRPQAPRPAGGGPPRGPRAV